MNQRYEDLEKSDDATIDFSYVSETASEMVFRLKRIKEECIVQKKPVPPLTLNQIEKLKGAAKPTDDFFQHYKTGKLIGQGHICEGVYECELQMTGAIQCVKILNRGMLKFFDRHRFQKEVDVLAAMDHPNIVTLENYFVTASRYFIVMEYAMGPEIFQHLNKRKKGTNKFR